MMRAVKMEFTLMRGIDQRGHPCCSWYEMIANYADLLAASCTTVARINNPIGLMTKCCYMIGL